MPIAGKLTDRLGSRLPAVVGLLVVLAGLSVYTQIDATTSRLLLGTTMFVVGIGHGTMMPSIMAAAYARLERPSIPAATAASNVVVRVGSSFGVAALAVALQIFIRHEVPGASGTIASAAAIRTPDALMRLSHAFGSSFWLALGIGTVTLIPLVGLPGRVRPAPSVVQPDGTVAEPADDRV
jgi:MFS family permease